MSSANLDAANLAAALAAPGLIREDVIETVYNLDEGIPTPFTDAVRSDSFSNLYSEWTEEDLTAPDTDNAVIDGADASGNDTKLGIRVGNRAQLSDKVVRISDASEAVNSIGGMGRMAYQTAKRLMDLRRDVEAIATGRQASVADNGTSTAGRTAGLAAWIATNTDFGSGGSAGGFNTATKLVDAPVAGEGRALTWAMVRAQLLAVYNAGGFPSMLMTVPGEIAAINPFLFSDAGKPFRAQPTANVGGTGGGATQTAQGYISVVLSDFGIALSLVDNRLQQTYDDASGGTAQTVADVFILDPRFLGLSYLYGYRQKELGNVGHSSNRLISTHWMTKCFREDAHALIADINPASAVTAS
jgi:hypothetical protein